MNEKLKFEISMRRRARDFFVSIGQMSIFNAQSDTGFTELNDRKLKFDQSGRVNSNSFYSN